MTIKNSLYYIYTFGCTFNKADSQKIETILNINNYKKSNEIEKTDLIIINSCAVKHTTETKIISLLKELRIKYPNKKIVMAGCLPQIDRKTNIMINKIIGENGGIIEPYKIENIVEFIKIKETNSKLYSKLKKDEIFPLLNNKITGIIQISEGCNHNCAYCATRTARGKLKVFNPIHIIQQIDKMFSAGIREFLITSQDVGNYQYENIDLIQLIKKILKLKNKMMIRIGMINPDYLIDNIEKFLELFKDERLYRFLHIPIQSGDNEVLRNMRRTYKIEDVNIIFKKIKEFDERFTISTDVICGFPLETIEQFKNTIRFIRYWKPEILNISKYSNRPGTEAKKMKQLPSQEIKRRSKELSNIYRDYKKEVINSWLNWEGPVFNQKKDRKIDKLYREFRNNYYIPIFILKDRENLDNFKIEKIKIKKIIKNHLIGEINK